MIFAWDLKSAYSKVSMLKMNFKSGWGNLCRMCIHMILHDTACLQLFEKSWIQMKYLQTNTLKGYKITSKKKIWVGSRNSSFNKIFYNKLRMLYNTKCY
jgi:hypothetical protein